MKKIFILIFLIVVILIGFYWKDFLFFGFKETGSKSVIIVENNLQEQISGKIEITISSETPVLKFSILPGEKKELIIDWDEVRKNNPWGEGNIWFIVEYSQGEEIKTFIGEVELYEDGRNYQSGFKNKIEIKQQNKGKIFIQTNENY